MPAPLAALRRDLGFAVRQCRRAPVFALGVVLSLGFGIGASATVYSWIRSMLLQPLPGVVDAGRLVSVRPEQRHGFGVSRDEYLEWRRDARSYTGLAASSFGLFALQTADSGAVIREPIYGIFASGNYFELLGLRPALGRLFTPEDDADGAEPVAVLSHVAWERRFGGDPAAVGRTVRVNGRAVRIVGVAPRRFGGTIAVARFDLWLPLHSRPLYMPGEAEVWRRRDYRWIDVIGRLGPGVELAAAHAEIQAIARGQAERFEENRDRGARVIPLDIGSIQRIEPQLLALAAVTLLVVLLICSNVANLLLTRAAARERELAVRLSLGASGPRLMGQLLSESGLLALAGAAVGVLIAANGEAILSLFMPRTSVGFEVPTRLDLGFLGFVVAVTAGCVLAFGLPPAMLAARTVPAETLKQAGGGAARQGGALRAALVVAQFALALSILVGAAVFLRRDRAVHAMDLGYRDGDGVLLAQAEMSLAGYADPERWRATIEEAVRRVGTLPGVREVALASFVPLSITGYTRRPVTVPSYPHEPGGADRVLTNGVSEGYFDLMGIPLLEGRGFDARDTPDGPRAVVVNQAFAEKYFAGTGALGKGFRLGGDEVVVIGIARNGRYDYREIDNANLPLVYYAWHQSPAGFVTFHVRTEGSPLGQFGPIRSAIHGVDPAITLLPPSTLQEAAGVPFAVSRSALQILAFLGGVALLLASMGLFAVVSYGASLRNRELGIRMALGATGSGIMMLVLRGALLLVVAGTGAGIVAAIGLTAALRNRMSFLPDPLVWEYAVPALLLGGAAVVAGWLPARKAARVDPARTLRD